MRRGLHFEGLARLRRTKALDKGLEHICALRSSLFEEMVGSTVAKMLHSASERNRDFVIEKAIHL